MKPDMSVVMPPNTSSRTNLEIEAILEKSFLKFYFATDRRNLPPFSSDDKNLWGYKSTFSVVG
jgi:hypothetical protein